MQPGSLECKLRIRAAMMLLWKSAGTGHYGYSGEIPVAVVRPLAAIEGPWTWTLLVGPPTVLQAFEAAGERPSLSRAQNMVEEAWTGWWEVVAVSPTKREAAGGGEKENACLPR